ncbi:hypothetical protein AGMMS49975_25420 [Clostridia bacterium]|nr:hypothetical protein AGMMS49975_25420 [Clostridia bacterium]
MSFLIEFKEYRERESKSLEFVRGAYEFTEKQKEVWKNTIETYHRWNISIGATRSGKTFLDYFKIPYRIHAIGADKITQVKRLQGARASYIYGDEVTTWSEEVFEMLKSRLDKKSSCFDGTCNPDNPNHWFKKFLDNDSGTDIYSMKFIIDDNTHLDADFVETLKREYAGKVYYDRYILGEWAIAEGAIYGGFKPSQAVNAPPKILEYSVGIDYGQSNATVFLLCGRGIDGRLYVLSEYYHSGRSIMTRRRWGSPRSCQNSALTVYARLTMRF